MSQDRDWLSVIGKALSYLCVQNSALKDKTLAQKAIFLDGIGLERNEIASMLESTPASIAELIRQTKAAKKGGSKIAKKAKKKQSK